MGFRGHSEVGWVLREYNDLMIKAQKLDIKLPDSYYTDGKIKGKTSKDTGVDPPKTAQKAEALVKKVDVSDTRTKFNDDMEENETNSPLKKPSLNELPTFIKKIKASEIPGLLEGLKSSKRK